MDDFGYLFRTFIGYICSTFSALDMPLRSTDPRFTFYLFIYLLLVQLIHRQFPYSERINITPNNTLENCHLPS